MDTDGIIAAAPDKKGLVNISLGSMSVKVPLNELALSDKMPEAPVKKQKPLDLSKATGISPEINVIGSRVDDAIARIDKYLDDACISGMESVRIIHGKGTGALRSSIRDYLRTSPSVSGFEEAAHGEGDAGVTVVKLR